MTTTVHTASTSSKVLLTVSWKDLHYRVGDKEILKGLTGAALPARSLAIMGSSGAGKTTLLNAISDRLLQDATHVISGELTLNDVKYDHKYRKVIAFVTQDDVVASMATPTTALYFSYRIRRGATPMAAENRVNEMLGELNLTNSKDTVVGIPGLVVGLSGGERKRTNIGVELITDPKVLLLDEPTSGLDSVTSVKIVALLRDLARKGRTVIYTIHQPTAEMLQYFDDLMLLALGKVVYHGPMDGAVDYFETIGYRCPDTHTPSDYFMTLLQDGDVAPKLIEAWDARLMNNASASPHLVAGSPLKNRDGDDVDTRQYLDTYVAQHGSSLGIQFVELLIRSVGNVLRNRMYIIMQFVQGTVFALISGLIFAKLEPDVAGVQDRQGVLFMVAANKAFSGVMAMINTFPADKAVFIREQQAGAYSPALYFLTKTLAEFPVQMVANLLECVILYFITGLVIDGGRFFYYYGVVFFEFQVAAGLGLAISAAIDSYVVAAGFAPLIVVPMMLAGGLMASTARLWPYWVWLEKLSFIRHAYVLIMKNEFETMDKIDCDASRYGVSFCSRQAHNGTQVIGALGFDTPEHSEWAMWVSLLVLFCLGRLICIAALYRVARSKF